MHLKFLWKIFLFGGFFAISGAWAKRFNNEYLEFELPIGWECIKEGSEYVCQSTNEKRQKEAIIILAAKKRGESDSLEKYQEHLSQPKTFQPPGELSQVSEPKVNKVIKINGHPWVDALHLASEIPGFYTRYLATVKSDIGVAVTFSVAKDFYSTYQAVFEKVIQTLRVIRNPNKKLAKIRLKEGQGLEGPDTLFVPESGLFGPDKRPPTQGKISSEESGDFSLILIIVLIAGVGFIIIRKKKQGRK